MTHASPSAARRDLGVEAPGRVGGGGIGGGRVGGGRVGGDGVGGDVVAGAATRGERMGRIATVVSLAMLLLVGWLGESAAKPPLGERGWAPGSLPWSPSSEVATGGLATAYLLGGLGLWCCRRSMRPWPWWAIGLLAAGALLTMPFGSADHTNYAAYGRIALQGGDPYVESPIAWAGGTDPVTSGVQPPWQQTPSVYGPLATLLQTAAAWLGGDNLRQVIWCWQLMIVATFVGTRWLLRRLFPRAHGRVDALWTTNPLLVGTGVLGAHVDMLATALMVAALLAVRGAGGPDPRGAGGVSAVLAAGVLGGLALSVKITAGVVLVAILLGWVLMRAGARHVVPLIAGAVVAAVPLHVWAGGQTYEQLGRSRRSISLASPWRKVYEWFGGHLPDSTWRAVIVVAAGVLCVVLAILVWRLLQDGTPTLRGVVGVALALSIAYAVGAPYVLPWYDQLVWALLPALTVAGVGAGLMRAWIVRGVLLSLAYVPGRVVAMSPEVAGLTMGWRSNVAPLAAVIVMGSVLAAAWRRRAVNGSPGVSSRG